MNNIAEYRIVCESIEYYNSQVLNEIGMMEKFKGIGQAFRGLGQAAKGNINRGVARVYQAERDASNKARKFFWNKAQNAQAGVKAARTAAAANPGSIRSALAVKGAQMKKNLFGWMHGMAKKNQQGAASRFATVKTNSDMNFHKAGVNVPTLK